MIIYKKKEEIKMKNTIKDFDLDLKTSEKRTAEPYVGSRYLCTPGSCWKLVCFTTTIK